MELLNFKHTIEVQALRVNIKYGNDPTHRVSIVTRGANGEAVDCIIPLSPLFSPQLISEPFDPTNKILPGLKLDMHMRSTATLMLNQYY